MAHRGSPEGGEGSTYAPATELETEPTDTTEDADPLWWDDGDFELDDE